MYVCMYVCIGTGTQTHTHTDIHTYIHTYSQSATRSHAHGAHQRMAHQQRHKPTRIIRHRLRTQHKAFPRKIAFPDTKYTSCTREPKKHRTLTNVSVGPQRRSGDSCNVTTRFHIQRKPSVGTSQICLACEQPLSRTQCALKQFPRVSKRKRNNYTWEVARAH